MWQADSSCTRAWHDGISEGNMHTELQGWMASELRGGYGAYKEL